MEQETQEQSRREEVVPESLHLLRQTRLFSSPTWSQPERAQTSGDKLGTQSLATRAPVST